MTVAQQFQAFIKNTWYAYDTSDLVSKAIVLALCVLSMYAWSTMIEKGFSLGRVRRSCRRFLEHFESAESVLELSLRESDFGGPLAEAYFVGLMEVMNILEVDASQVDLYCRRRLLPRLLTENEIVKVRAVIERSLTRQNQLIEERLGMLGTIVTLAPFLGLLGTVWGVMMAFVGMAQQGRPDLSVLAPGVSGALLTTVVGLVVAIPSVVGLNGILSWVKQTNVDMDNFVDDFVAKIRLEKTGAIGGAQAQAAPGAATAPRQGTTAA
ncbi:MAG: MotA/TolQ/ExbB proton channel family protein [Lentisphaerae bacterium]|nr:MotA/TolQ/ExbB proton channel family protein [Lentisphaerota bacterium]